MKIASIILVVVLALLAISSGITKVLLLPQDVEFFGAYGFSNPLLIAYGAVQLLGGLGLLIAKTRVIGAVVVAVTFLISAAVLYLAGQTPVLIVTLIAILLLILVIKR